MHACDERAITNIGQVNEKRAARQVSYPGPAHSRWRLSAREWQQAQHTASEVVAPRSCDLASLPPSAWDRGLTGSGHAVGPAVETRLRMTRYPSHSTEIISRPAAEPDRRLGARLRHGQQSHEVIALSATGQLGMAAAGQILRAVVTHLSSGGDTVAHALAQDCARPLPSGCRAPGSSTGRGQWRADVNVLVVAILVLCWRLGGSSRRG